MKEIVEFFELGGQKIGPSILGLAVGSAFVIGATYALLKIKGMPGGLFDGVKVGANCGFCRPFWISFGAGIVGTILLVKVITHD